MACGEYRDDCIAGRGSRIAGGAPVPDEFEDSIPEQDGRRTLGLSPESTVIELPNSITGSVL